MWATEKPAACLENGALGRARAVFGPQVENFVQTRQFRG